MTLLIPKEMPVDLMHICYGTTAETHMDFLSTCTGSQQESSGKCHQSSTATTALVCILAVVTVVAAVITIAAIIRHRRRMMYKVSSESIKTCSVNASNLLWSCIPKTGADSAKNLEESRKEHGRQEKNVKNTYRLLSSDGKQY